MTTTTMTQEQEYVTKLIGEGCARFMKNTKEYKRCPLTGTYQWAWNGFQVIARVPEDSDVKKLMAMFPSYRVMKLHVNGKHLGEVRFSQPQRHGGYFLYLTLSDEMAYNWKVIRRFADIAGYVDPKFDASLVEMTRPVAPTGGDIVID